MSTSHHAGFVAQVHSLSSVPAFRKGVPRGLRSEPRGEAEGRAEQPEWYSGGVLRVTCRSTHRIVPTKSAIKKCILLEVARVFEK